MSENCGHISDYHMADTDDYCWVIFFSICGHCVVYGKHAFGPTLDEELKMFHLRPDKVLFCDKCLEPRNIRQVNTAINNTNIKIINTTR